MFSPLSGIRVLDLSHLLVGPYCSYLMALMGAEVIKVEPLEGDWTRGQGSDRALNEKGMGLTYQAQNAGKRSIAVNLKDPRGIALVKRMAAGWTVPRVAFTGWQVPAGGIHARQTWECFSRLGRGMVRLKTTAKRKFFLGMNPLENQRMVRMSTSVISGRPRTKYSR